MFLWWPLPSSTSDEGSEQCFLTDGALACHKCSFPVDGGGGHYRKVGFYEHPLTLKKKVVRFLCAYYWYSCTLDFTMHSENSNKMTVHYHICKWAIIGSDREGDEFSSHPVPL